MEEVDQCKDCKFKEDLIGEVKACEFCKYKKEKE